MKKIIISISLSIICLVVGIFSFLTNDVAAYHHWMAENGPRIMENFRKDRDRGNRRGSDRKDDRRGPQQMGPREDRDHHDDKRGPRNRMGPENRDHHQGPGMNQKVQENPPAEENK